MITPFSISGTYSHPDNGLFILSNLSFPRYFLPLYIYIYIYIRVYITTSRYRQALDELSAISKVVKTEYTRIYPRFTDGTVRRRRERERGKKRGETCLIDATECYSEETNVWPFYDVLPKSRLAGGSFE